MIPEGFDIHKLVDFLNEEEMVELTNTNNQLASKVEAIEEEKREMRKKIDEMKLVCDLKAQNDSY